MSWTRTYRLALYVLPTGLRRKHGSAMERLFARELQRARERSRLQGMAAGAAGIWDVVRRGAYEQVRPSCDVPAESHDVMPWERWDIHAHEPQRAGADSGDPHMQNYTTRQLLRRHASSFAIAFLALTAILLVNFARKQIPELSARGASAGTIAEAMLFAVPFIAAMTIPMAVFIAVLREFTRLRADGTLAAALRERNGLRRLLRPVLLAAVGIAVLELVVAAEVVPRANAQLAAVIKPDGRTPQSDRTMTIGQLREAERSIQAVTESDVLGRAAAYEVEVQKKLALAAACVVLALAAAAIALRVPRGGMWLVFGASFAVFTAYYMLIVAGETLADRMVVSPLVGMWWANAFLLVGALLLMTRRRRAPRTPDGSEAVVARG